MVKTIKKVSVCPSPALLGNYYLEESIVVMIDIVRASTSICMAFENGAKKIKPVATIEEAIALRKQGFLIAGERESLKVEGFDFGNSPIEFSEKAIDGQLLAITTTNGTQALEKTLDYKYDTLVIGCYTNMDALINFLFEKHKNVVLLCAGWKDLISIEDFLFAGAISEMLLNSGTFSAQNDSVYMAINQNSMANKNEYDFIMASSPRMKQKESILQNDIRFCLQKNLTNTIPIHLQGELLPFTTKNTTKTLI